MKSPPSSEPLPNGSPHPALDANVSSGPRRLPSETRRKNPWPWIAAAVVLATGGGAGAYFAFFSTANAERPDVLLHKVKKEDLHVTVTEKGTLESADNRDVVCKVRAGSKGYSTTINWVIDDGTQVKKNQLLMILDDSDFQDRYRDQKIKVDTALANKLDAEEQYAIVLKQNEIDIATSETKVAVAEIALEQYLGYKADDAQMPLAAVVGCPGLIAESGMFRQQFDDLTGQIRLAESEVEQNRERTAWAERMVKMRYMSPAQAQAERSKLESSIEKLRSVQSQRSILGDYTRRFEITTRRSALDDALKVLDQQRKKAQSSEIQATVKRNSANSVYIQESEKLKEIEDQIRECRIHAPQDGMVVYFKSESSSRFSSNSNVGMIEQGAQVKEGQKMLRIPDLKRMQVNTKIHEAMVGRIKGDIRKSTGFYDSVRLGFIMNPNPLTRLTSLQDELLERVRNNYRARETFLASQGQRATIRVDAMGSDRALRGHVRSVAQMASQQDFFSSDVKMYSTLVLIDEEVEGLKPDMTAEVTIHVDDVRSDTLAIPLQCVIGGTELGSVRKVFVKANGGYEEREVKLGLANERMVEVVEGLKEGDEVVINPKVLVGDKARTYEADDARPARPGAPDAKSGSKKKKGAPPPKEPLPQ